MKRREFLQISGAGAALATTGVWAKARDERPNFIVIVADDMGYADVGCFGRTDVKTPAIDSLASEGLKFEHGYANSCVCTPSRVALITGRYQNRLPIGQEEPLGTVPVGLEPTEPSLPAQLRAAGYQTSLVGKWHLGSLDKYSPLKNGYEHFWGLRGGGVDYFTHSLTIGPDAKPDIWDGDVRADEIGYLTDLIGTHGANEIRRLSSGGKPYLLSLHFTAPHWPWEGPQDQAISAGLTDAQHHDGGTIETYRRMIESLDANVAKVLAALQKSGNARNTVVLFTSDNGGERFAKTWPFNGMKGEVLEGGIRVPLIARWPARIRARTVTQQTAMTMDVMPTLLDAAGITPDASRAPDGISLLPTFATPSQVRVRELFWRYNAHKQAAARRGQYKFLRMDDTEYLFDIVADPQERGNLKARQPAVFEELKAAWEKWNAQMLAYTPQNATYDNKASKTLVDRY
jgi:arylsulfatase A-like enzyme